MAFAKAVRHMEALKVSRLPVINKSKRMVGILSLGDVSHSAPSDLLSECVKGVSAQSPLIHVWCHWPGGRPIPAGPARLHAPCGNFRS